ncbi:MAG: acyl-CoA dehydrogenase, partial [Gammaproteobacteria bacterium]
MDFRHTPRTLELLARLQTFMDAEVYPVEAQYYAEVAEGSRWEHVPLLAGLQEKARAAGLWNLFLP